jgi:hypothetical protein
MPVNNVGLLVYFRLWNKPLLVFVKGLGSLSLVMLVWEIPASAPTAGEEATCLVLESLVGLSVHFNST